MEKETGRTVCMIFDVAVIGGGASGLCLAVMAQKKGKKVILWEKEEKVATKLLMTGNGKCNLSATDVSPTKYNHPDFVENILKCENIITFFQEIGLMTKQTEQRIYPYSESALTVVGCLRQSLGDTFVLSEKVEKIEKKKELFCLNGKYQAKKVALCTGSNATKGCNSHTLYAPFGHTATPLVPALTPLQTDTKYIKGLSGLRAKVTLSVLHDGQKIKEERGELLFRDNGISGIVSLGISSFLARHQGKYDLSCDFVWDKSEEEISRFLQHGKVSGIVHQSIAQAIERFAQKTSVSISHALKNFILSDVKTGGNAQAQVMHGGLRVDEFSPYTLESNLQKGLYACGEVLDIDGECGGYNLHWAFVSALRVAKQL